MCVTMNSTIRSKKRKETGVRAAEFIKNYMKVLLLQVPRKDQGCETLLSFFS